MIKCVVFDFDDTLVYSEHKKRQTFYDLVSHIEGGEEKMTEVLATFKKGDDRFSMFAKFAKWWHPENPEKYGKELAEKYGEIIEEYIETCDEIKGATETLEFLLNKGITIYINSATPEESLLKAVNRRGWSRYFKDVYGRPTSKEDNLRKIIKNENLASDEIIMVGDGDNDRVAAEELQTHFIGIKSKIRSFTAPVDKIAEDMCECGAYIKAML